MNDGQPMAAEERRHFHEIIERRSKHALEYMAKLEHELALARASSDYWRTRYIDAAARIERAGALAWFQSIVRTEPLTLDNAWDRYTCE